MPALRNAVSTPRERWLTRKNTAISDQGVPFSRHDDSRRTTAPLSSMASRQASSFSRSPVGFEVKSRLS